MASTAPSATPRSAPVATYPDLRGKVALVTGIGQVGDQKMWGNGAAIARVLVANGVKVFGCDLNASAAEHTRSRLLEAGGECTVMAADVTQSDAVKEVVRACVAKYDRIDLLVNNVGLSQPGGPAEMEEHVWDQQTDVNLKSVYLTCHHVLPLMETQGSGVVINVSSIAAMMYVGKPQIAYNATKAAIIGFTTAAAVMYAPKGVRMNVVVPGLIHTPLVGVLADKYAGGDYEGLVKRRENAVPMGRMGDAFDVAYAAVFLMSEQAGYITGQKLVVDGGITSTTGWQSG